MGGVGTESASGRRWRTILPSMLATTGRGYVSLGVTLRAPGLDLGNSAWSARAVFVLEAGEEMTRLAADLSHFLAT
nr:DUF6228 family protein [Micromonospora sp. HM5-17]